MCNRASASHNPRTQRTGCKYGISLSLCRRRVWDIHPRRLLGACKPGCRVAGGFPQRLGHITHAARQAQHATHKSLRQHVRPIRLVAVLLQRGLVVGHGLQNGVHQRGDCFLSALRSGGGQRLESRLPCFRLRQIFDRALDHIIQRAFPELFERRRDVGNFLRQHFYSGRAESEYKLLFRCGPSLTGLLRPGAEGADAHRQKGGAAGQCGEADVPGHLRPGDPGVHQQGAAKTKAVLRHDGMFRRLLRKLVRFFVGVRGKAPPFFIQRISDIPLHPVRYGIAPHHVWCGHIDGIRVGIVSQRRQQSGAFQPRGQRRIPGGPQDIPHAGKLRGVLALLGIQPRIRPGVRRIKPAIPSALRQVGFSYALRRFQRIGSRRVCRLDFVVLLRKNRAQGISGGATGGLCARGNSTLSHIGMISHGGIDVNHFSRCYQK